MGQPRSPASASRDVGASRVKGPTRLRRLSLYAIAGDRKKDRGLLCCSLYMGNCN